MRGSGESIKVHGVEVGTRDASEVPGAYSVPVVKIIGHKVVGSGGLSCSTSSRQSARRVYGEDD